MTPRPTIVRAKNTGNRWCAEATLAAFGIEHQAGLDGGTPTREIQRKLKDAGYTLTEAHDYNYDLNAATPIRTLAQWTARNLRHGLDYVLFTEGHVMALRGNVLTDTDGPGPGLRRRVNMAYRVTKEN